MLNLKSVISVFIFSLLFLGYFHPLTSFTQDLGRHLTTGNLILQTHTVPKTNLFSYTYPNFPFINHHWLSEVLFALIFKVFGANGLLILTIFIVFVAFALIFSFVYKKTNAPSLAIASLLLLPILFERTDVRPEIFSFLFLSIFMLILYKFKEKFTKWIFILPLLELLWINIHIYFLIGAAVLFFFLIDSIIPVILNLFQDPDSNKIPKPAMANNILILFFVLIASISLTLINPNGIKGAFYPLNVFQNYGYSIQENQNIFFLWNYSHNQAILFFGISTILLFLSLILTIKKTYFADWLICIFFVILAMSAIRNFPLFVFAAFIPFTKSLSNFKLFTLQKNLKYIFLIFLLGLFLFEAQQIYTKKGVGFGIGKGAENGVNFFLKNDLKGPIFNNFDIGSYLIYRLYPKEKVFIDGRPEAYPASFIQEEYIPMQSDEKKFDSEDKKYKFNTLFFSHTDQTPWAEKFIKQISENKKWTLAYLDDFSVIWTKDKNIKPQIQTDYPNMQSLIQLAHFFQNTNFTDREIKILQKIISIDPKSCPALYNLALKLQEIQDPSFSIFLNKYQQNCR